MTDVALGLVIGGELTGAGGGRTYPVFEPAKGERLADVPDATGDDVDRAVASATLAAPTWKALGPMGRAEILRGFAAAARDHGEELAVLDSRNTGNPISGMRHGAAKGANALEFFCGLAVELGGKTIPATPDHLHYTLREPHGVVGVITAYNHPAMFALARTAAALVAGNCVVLKPAGQAPMSAIRIGQIAVEHLPPGVFNVVSGGAETGTALVEHPGVARINFTGSLPTALRIQAAAAGSGHVKHLGLQLGGKNPLIVMPDVDVAVAARAAVDGMNLFKVLGQSCGSTSRVFVHSSMHDEFVGEVARTFEALRVGDPLDEKTDIGALISDDHRRRVAEHVASGVGEGATLVAGGSIPSVAGLEGGYFYSPTLFADVAPEMQIASREIFGPVLSVLRWDDEETMIEAVNSVRYGLTASIYTDDLQSAHRLAAAVDAGYVWINDVEKRWIGVPFGGKKDSGTSTEYSIEELHANTRLKAVSVRLGPS